jgi:hypothetical protein
LRGDLINGIEEVDMSVEGKVITFLYRLKK